MLQKTTFCALSALVAAVTAGPAFADGLGQSGWVKPDTSNYVPSGSFAKFLEGQVSQTSPTQEDMNQTPASGDMGNMNQMPMNYVPTMNYAPSNVGAAQMPMNYAPNVGAATSAYASPARMTNEMGNMNQMPMNNTTNMALPFNPGGDQNMQSGGGVPDGIGTAMAAAAAIGLGAQTAINSVGDAMRGMGFGGGFRGVGPGAGNYELSPFGGTGLGYHGPGHLGGGGGGGDYYTGTGGGGGGVRQIGRTLNRAVNRNIGYAADQATDRLIYGLWNH
jgi:hypothetical protein